MEGSQEAGEEPSRKSTDLETQSGIVLVFINVDRRAKDQYFHFALQLAAGQSE